MIRFDERDMRSTTDQKHEAAKLVVISEKLDVEGFDYTEYVGHFMNGSRYYQFVNTKEHKSFFVKYDDETDNVVFGYHNGDNFVYDQQLTAQECVERDDLNPS